MIRILLRVYKNATPKPWVRIELATPRFYAAEVFTCKISYRYESRTGVKVVPVWKRYRCESRTGMKVVPVRGHVVPVQLS